MRALSSMPFCPCDGRQTGLLYLPARWRDTTQTGAADRTKDATPWHVPLQIAVRWGHFTRFKGPWNYPQQTGTRPALSLGECAAAAPRGPEARLRAPDLGHGHDVGVHHRGPARDDAARGPGGPDGRYLGAQTSPPGRLWHPADPGHAVYGVECQCLVDWGPAARR